MSSVIVGETFRQGLCGNRRWVETKSNGLLRCMDTSVIYMDSMKRSWHSESQFVFGRRNHHDVITLDRIMLLPYSLSVVDL